MQEESSCRVRLLQLYLNVLYERRLPVDPLLSQCEMGDVDLHAGLALIPLLNFLSFTNAMAAMLNDRHLGLKIGSETREADLGLRGLFIIHMDTLRNALDRYAHYIRAIQDATQLRLQPSGRDACVIYQFETIDIATGRHEVERSLASLVTSIRFRLGSSWRPVEVHFEHGLDGRSRSAYERIFNAPVFFEQPVSQLIISSQDLDVVSPKARPDMTNFAELKLDALCEEMQTTNDVTGSVILAIKRRLGEARVTLSEIANDLELSPRTLQRHLSSEGLSFQQIVKMQRQRTTRALIGSGERPTIAAIAERVGYSDESALARAFKDWTGISPARYAKIAQATR